MRSPRAAMMVFVLAAMGGCFVHRVGAGQPPPVTDSGGSQDQIAALNDTTRPVSERLAAANRLVLSGDASAVFDRLSELIRGPIGEGTPAWCLLRSMGDTTFAAPSLFAPVSQRLSAATPAEQPVIIRALASFRTRESARLLISLTEPGHEADCAQAAFAAVARLTGRYDLPQNHTAWEQWYRGVERLSEADWRASVALAQSDRADRLAELSDVTTRRLLESLRRLHLSVPEGERSEFLASLLRDELTAVRGLGFELVARELAASRAISPSVADAAIALLRNPDTQTRVQAATLLSQLAPAHAAEPIASALMEETDPVAAAALLDAASRWPSVEIAPVIVRWLSSEPATQRAAIEGSWALCRAGVLAGEEREIALRSLRALSPDLYNPSACQLLAAVGNEADRNSIVRLLESDKGPVRGAVAQSLSGYPQYADDILKAAAGDAELFSIASRVVAWHLPDRDGFERLRALPAPTPAAYREGLLLAAGVLGSQDLLRVARETVEGALREDLFELLVAETRIMSEGVEPRNAQLITEGAFDLASMHLKAGRADLAAAALDAVDSIALSEQRAGLTDLRCTTMLALNQIEGAERLEASAEAWLEGLRLAADKPHAENVLAAFTFRFGGMLNDDQIRRFAALAEQIRRSSSASTKEPDDPPKK